MPGETWCRQAYREGRFRLVRAEAVTVSATAPTLVCKANPRRVRIIVFNHSANNGFIHKKPGQTTSQGGRIGATSGSSSLTVEEHGEAVQGELWGIFATADSDFWVEEYEGFD